MEAPERNIKTDTQTRMNQSFPGTIPSDIKMN